MALWMKHSEQTTQGEGGRSCWTCLNILCIYFQRIKLPYRSKKKGKWEELLAVVWSVRCSCSAQQLLRDSAFSIGYKCVRNPKWVVCVPAGAEGARPLSLSLIGTTCPPEEGGKSQPVSPGVDLRGDLSCGASTGVYLGVLNKGKAVTGNSLTSFIFL